MTRPQARAVVPLLLACITLSACARRAATRGPLDDARIDRRIDALLARMTLEEKLGQLNQFSHGRGAGPGLRRGDPHEMIARGQLGAMLNATGAARTNELQRIAVERSRLGIPLLFGLDVIHGYHTTFPIPLALAATWDVDLVERAAAVAAREARADGIRWTFSPMVDIARDARWGRIVEGAGEDPYLGSVLAAAYVRGYQGRKLSDPTSIAACAKHYVAYGAAEGGRDYNTTDVPARTLRDVYLPPFKAAVDAGAVTLMSAFNAIDGVPASANAHALDQILRREWGFRGFVVSDWTAVKELIEHGIANDGAAAARKALAAGVDMDMEGELYLHDLPAEVRAGRVPLAVVDEAVRRVLRVKFALGLFEQPYTDEREPSQALDPADVELARRAAEESFVLLKNEPGIAGGAPILPLAGDVRRIALIGPLADAPRDMLGTWRGRGDERHVVTLRTALAEHCARHGIELTYAKGSELIGGSDDGIAAAADAARQADVVLLAVGEDGRDMTGEAASRASIDLPGLQPQLLRAVAAAGKPLVLLVFSGRPLALTPYVDHAAAVVQAWHPGIQAGPALVRVLSGAVNFTGRLTVSMPRSVGQLPLYYNHLNTGRPKGADPDEKFVSKYIDEENTPLYPFGHGLSYTRFEYGPPRLSASSLSARAINDGSATVLVTADVRNAGDRDGVEVVQVYIRQRGTSVARPVRELKGFRSVALRAGESRRVEFTLGRDELAFWNLQMKHLVEPALVTIWVTKDAQAGAGVALNITE